MRRPEQYDYPPPLKIRDALSLPDDPEEPQPRGPVRGWLWFLAGMVVAVGALAIAGVVP